MPSGTSGTGLNHRKYQALCQQLAEAGWEPLTLARSRDPRLAVERFGTAETGESLLHRAERRTSAGGHRDLPFPSDALPQDPVVVDEVGSAAGWPRRRVKGESLDVPLRSRSRSHWPFCTSRRGEQLARQPCEQILATWSWRQMARDSTRTVPESLVHWPRRAVRHVRAQTASTAIVPQAGQ